MPSSRYRFFAVVSPGLEPLLEQELRELGVTGRTETGGLEAQGSLEDVWRVHRDSRLTESVRVRLKAFEARSFAELESGFARLPWHAYLKRGTRIVADVTCHKSRLYHSDAVAERLHRSIEARLGPMSEAAPGVNEQRIFVRVVSDRVQTSIDASGDRLHRRGYRTHVTRAPLRETLAAALARLFEQHRAPAASTPVWDPFCGSGTLLIEWLELRANLAPGARRGFAFENWPIHDAAHYRAWCDAQPTPDAPSGLRALGSDSSARALEAARANSERAGVSRWCEWQQADFREHAPRVPEGAGILTNPPYGVRLKRDRSTELLSAFDALLAARTDLRPVIMACGDPRYLRTTELRWQKAARFKSGGLPVHALVLPRSSRG